MTLIDDRRALHAAGRPDEIVVGSRAVYAYTGTRAFDPSLPTVMFVHGAATDRGVFALPRYFARRVRSVPPSTCPAWTLRRRRTDVRRSPTGCDVLARPTYGKRVSWVSTLGALVALECAAGIRTACAALHCSGRRCRWPSTTNCSPLRLQRSRGVPAHRRRSFSAGARLGGSEAPGMWMTGSAMRLLGRYREGVPTDLLASPLRQSRRAAVRCPTLAISRRARRHGTGARAGARRRTVRCGRVTLAETGHSMMAERPGDVLDALRPFL
jgi:pimeloyl-ACP methyl ester carboxylesterase